MGILLRGVVCYIVYFWVGFFNLVIALVLIVSNQTEKLRAERKERESLEGASISSKWDFSCCELLEQLEIALCGPIQKQVDDDFEPPTYQQIHRNVVTVSESVARDPSAGFAIFTRPLS